MLNTIAITSTALLFLASPQVTIESMQVAPMPGTFGPAPQDRLKGENVLLILLDDLGIEQLKMYDMSYAGGEIPPPRTQYMDLLRERGILFHNTYVNPLCSPTRAMTLTGRYGFRTGLGKAARGNTTPDDFAISTDNVFVSQLIKEHYGDSYARGFFGKWHIAGHGEENNCDAVFPENRGFQVIEGQTKNNQGNHPDLGPQNHYRWVKVTASEDDSPVCPDKGTVPDPTTAPLEGEHWSPDINRTDAVDWINSQIRPWFAYVAFNPPHEPLHVPSFALMSKPTRNRMRRLGYSLGQPPNTSLGDPEAQKQEVFRSMIEGVDTEIGRLIFGMAPDDYARTTVIVMGDNGTTGARVPGELNGTTVPVKQGKRGVYELGTRVPLIVSGPHVPTAGMPVEGWDAYGLVSGVDIWHTVANLAGITDAEIDAIMVAKGAPAVDSMSFLPIIEDPSSSGDREFAYCEEFAFNGDPGGGCGDFATMRRAINARFDERWGTGHYKYVWKEFDDGSVVEELYNLDDDWLEESDLFPPAIGSVDETAYLELSAEMVAIHPDTTIEICQ
jgi:arylsulfatase A-like enzyme